MTDSASDQTTAAVDTNRPNSAVGGGSARDPVAVQYAAGVGNQVGAGVSGAARLVGDRTPGVAVVVANHEPPAIGQQSTETFLPPQHRRAGAHDEQERRVGGVAHGIRAQLDTVRLDHALGHPASSHRTSTETREGCRFPRAKR